MISENYNYLSFLQNNYDKNLQIPSSLILKYIDPVIILDIVLFNINSIEKKMSIIIKFLEICDNCKLLNCPLFVMNFGMDLFEYRIYMNITPNLISGELFAQKTVEECALLNNIPIMEWMHFYCFQYNYTFEDGTILDNESPQSEKRILWTTKVYENAVKNNNIDVLEWLITNTFCPYNNDIILNAIKNANLRTVTWILLKLQLPINIDALILTIITGNEKGFVLLEKFNYPITNEIKHIALKHGQLKILKYIYWKYPELFEINDISLNNLLQKEENYEIINWLYTINYTYNDTCD